MFGVGDGALPAGITLLIAESSLTLIVEIGVVLLLAVATQEQTA
jgi:hypothetical protein